MPRKNKYYRRKEDGLYETSRTINGKRVMFRGKTCREVDLKILQYQVEQNRGRMFSTVAKDWYNKKEKEVSAGTMMNYKIHYNRAIDYFNCYIKDITARDVQNFMLRFESNGYVAGYVRMQRSVLAQIFSYAVVAGDLECSPVSEVKLSRNLPQGERHPLTVEQERAVDQYRGDNWLLGVMLLYTGCRRGELFALTWRDIDHEAGVIHINKKISYSPNHRGTLEHHLKSKNGKRDIPLLTPLAAVLPRNRVGIIFPGSNEGGYMTAYEANLLWKSYSKAVGLEGITPHCFRHSFATICYEAGLDSKSAAAFLGDTESVTQVVYQELRKHHQIRGADLVNAYLADRAKEARQA